MTRVLTLTSGCPETLHKNAVMYKHLESAPCVFTHRLFVTQRTRDRPAKAPSLHRKLLTLFNKSADELLIV